MIQSLISYLHTIPTLQVVVWFIALGTFCATIVLFALELKFPREKQLAPAIVLSASVTAIAFAVDAIANNNPSASSFIAFFFGMMAIGHTILLAMRKKA